MKSNLHRLTNETVYIAETYQTRPFNIVQIIMVHKAKTEGTPFTKSN